MKTGRGWWALAGMVVLTLALYVGAYYALVRTTYRGWDPDFVAVPSYPSSGMTWFFVPIHRIDREWIRPKTWGPPP